MADGFELRGLVEMQRRLERMVSETPKEGARAVYEVALGVTRNSMRRTPVKTGAARASHVTEQPVVSGHDISCTIAVGGPALDYVVPLHERVEVHHDVGEAKFLEKSILEARPTFAPDVAARFDLNRLARR